MLTLILVSLLTAVVHLLGTFAYSARLSGVLSGKLSLSMSAYNLFSLASRFANVLMIPLLSKKIESELLLNTSHQTIPSDYLFILLAAIAGSAFGMFLFGRSVNLLYRSVKDFEPGKSLAGIIMKNASAFFSKPQVLLKREAVALNNTDYKYLVLNTAITCVFTSATLAAIYSSYVVPQFRVTAMSLAFILNGFASFCYAVVIDPYISLLTDNAYTGKLTLENYYFYLTSFIYSRLAGVLLSIITFKLFAYAIIRGIAIL